MAARHGVAYPTEVLTMVSTMFVMMVASAGGAIGWWAGSRLGIMTAFFLSLIGTAIGTWWARKWTR
jgi:hypothetical protein